MAMTVSVICALLAALSNAFASVLQRRAALTVPLAEGFHVRLITSLLHRPVWLAGIAAVICAAVFQALALFNGALSIVQPIFVLELPLALLIGGLMSHHPLSGRGWAGIGCIVVGIGLVLGGAAPSPGTGQASMDRWIPVLVACVAAAVVLTGTALRRAAGKTRAACFAGAAAIGYALTAAMMKSATHTWDAEGPAGFLTAWQTYGFAAAGVGALFLLENALQSGPLAASQPVLTTGDAALSLIFGVALYQERLRGGWWLLPELTGGALTLAGAVVLATTPVARMLLAPLPERRPEAPD